MPLTRSESIRFCTRLLRISDGLANDSTAFLNERAFTPARASKILLGLTIRDHLRGIRILMRSNLDNQALALFRLLIENFLNLEYLSRVTIRGKHKLTPADKGILFVSFPVYTRGLKDPSYREHPWFKRAEHLRLRLVKNHKYWHGSNLRDICIELDRVYRTGKTPNLNTYHDLYSDLSFASHPNSRESGYFEEDPTTAVIRLKPHFHFDPIGTFATFYAARSIRMWAITVKTGSVKRIDALIKDLQKALKLAAA